MISFLLFKKKEKEINVSIDMYILRFREACRSRLYAFLIIARFCAQMPIIVSFSFFKITRENAVFQKSSTCMWRG